MQEIGGITKIDKAAAGLGQSVNYAEQTHIPAVKLKAGSLKGKVPVVLDGGRTIVYRREDQSDEEIISKYNSH